MVGIHIGSIPTRLKAKLKLRVAKPGLPVAGVAIAGEVVAQDRALGGEATGGGRRFFFIADGVRISYLDLTDQALRMAA